MELKWVQLAQLTAAIISILMPVAIIPIWKLVNKVRTNDLHHLDMKIDSHHALIAAKLDAMTKTVEATDTKLDRHLDWHLETESARRR